jgi:hypothetical protein
VRGPRGGAERGDRGREGVGLGEDEVGAQEVGVERARILDHDAPRPEQVRLERAGRLAPCAARAYERDEWGGLGAVGASSEHAFDRAGAADVAAEGTS